MLPLKQPILPQIRRIELDQDYPSACAWWKAHNWPVLPKEALPEVGYIVPEICAAWLYRSDSSIAWIEWIIANPESDKEVRSEALDLLIQTVSSHAKELGFKFLFSSASHPHLIERYKLHGFHISDTAMTNLIKAL